MKPDTGVSQDSSPPVNGSTLIPGPSEKPPQYVDGSKEGGEERADFERDLADIANRLSNVSDGQFDEVVTGCLRTLVELLGFDRSSLMAFSENGLRFQVTHSWAIEGVDVAPTGVLLNAQVPWFTHQIRSGHIVSLSSSDDLPAVAAKERVYLLQSDLKSLLAIPLLTEGTIVGALSLAGCRSQKRWTLELVSQLRLVGEIFALGIRRYQYAHGLKTIAQTMDQLSLDHSTPQKKPIERLRDRARRLLQAEHHERRRMGEVLHEDVMQILAAARMFLQADTDGTRQSAAVAKAFCLLQEVVGKLRRLTLELRPETVFGMTLADGIRSMVDQVRLTYDLDVDTRIADTWNLVNDDVRSFLYDTSRKLLQNVALHASCNRATLELRRSDPYIQLVVSDDGGGFNPASLENLPSVGFGLFSIREQVDLFGGMMEVHSSPGHGTRVVVTVPANG